MGDVEEAFGVYAVEAVEAGAVQEDEQGGCCSQGCAFGVELGSFVQEIFFAAVCAEGEIFSLQCGKFGYQCLNVCLNYSVCADQLLVDVVDYCVLYVGILLQDPEEYSSASYERFDVGQAPMEGDVRREGSADFFQELGLSSYPFYEWTGLCIMCLCRHIRWFVHYKVMKRCGYSKSICHDGALFFFLLVAAVSEYAL